MSPFNIYKIQIDVLQSDRF